MQVTKIEATSQNKAITRYAAYARVSRHTEEQLLSFASQLKYYSNMFKESGHHNIAMPMLIPENLMKKESGCRKTGKCWGHILFCAI